MGANYRLYVLAVLVSAVVASSSCGGTDSATVTMPAATSAVSVKIEPDAIVPALDEHAACGAQRPFDLRFVVRLGGPEAIAFNRVHFKFVDGLGRIEFPQISMGGLSPGAITPNVGSIPIPTSGSILPSSTSIPMPNSNTLTSFGTTRELPLLLRFGCGVMPSGTLFVVVDFDDRGHSRSHELRVNVR